MLKKIQKEVEDLRIKVYAGQSLEDTEKALYEIEQMLFKAMDKQLNIPIVVDSEAELCGKPKCTRHKLDNSPLCSYHWDIANS